MEKRPTIRASATVLLLRDGGRGEPEILLTRRHGGMSFMGGLWVYPGGSLDAADSSGEALGRLTPGARAHCLKVIAGGPMRKYDEARGLGLFIAACRETFEEAGLLLARNRDGSPVDPALVALLQETRKALHGKDSADIPHSLFARLLAEHDLMLDAPALVYWAHWITPSGPPTRFDTHFFAMAAPPDQAVRIDNNEATEWRWVTPGEALAAHAKSEFPMAPPTLLTLREIADSHAAHGSLHAMLSAESGREIATILPRIVKTEGGSHTLMPWHPDYDAAPGDGVPPGTVYPEHLRRLPAKLERRRDSFEVKGAPGN